MSRIHIISSSQDSVLKAIRILVHNDKRPSASGLPGNAAPVREGWARKDGRPLTRRSSRRALPDAIGSVTTSLSYLCVRHVMQHCGPYLLDLLSPPAARGLGRTSLMAIREAAINGEVFQSVVQVLLLLSFPIGTLSTWIWEWAPFTQGGKSCVVP